MKIGLIVVAILAAVVVIVVITGYALPVEHTASAETTLPASPERIFSILTDVDSFPSWRSGLSSVEKLPSADGRRRFREVSNDGTVAFVIERSESPHVLVARIDDRSLPFGGTWTYELTPVDGGHTTLRITENGEVYNPVFRFVGRYFLRYDRTIRAYLGDIQRRLGRVN